MGSALLDTATHTPAYAEADDHSRAGLGYGARAAAGLAPSEALRLQVAERLAAHRDRRRAPSSQAEPDRGGASSPAPPAQQFANARTARIAAAVAERYSRSPSYRAFLAAEAERALQQAKAAAEIAELNVKVAEAQRQLLDALSENALCDDALRGDAHADADREQGPGQEVRSRESLGQELRNRERLNRELQSVFEEALWEQPAREGSLWPELEEARTSHPERTGTAGPSRRASAHRPTARRQAGRRSAADRPTAQTGSPRGLQSTQPAPLASASSAGLTVRLYEDTSGMVLPAAAHHANRSVAGDRAASDVGRGTHQDDGNDAEALALDEEIAFRQSPVFEEPASPALPLPANLIEFPRQLVASRKARPRYAEGPLREEADAAPGAGQLRIFEVDPAEISTTPTLAETAVPQWTSIWLDAPGRSSAGADANPHASGQPADFLPATAPALCPASIVRRLIAAWINAFIVLAGSVAFAATFVLISGESIARHSGGPVRMALGWTALREFAAAFAGETGLQAGAALATGLIAFGFFYLAYQALFFWFSEATPGMRIARIALCTFSDENPSRPAMRWRLPALLLSACPLGLGFAWAALDEDRLTWHDRLTRMYQRSY
jgi:hypothetical protein